MIKRIHDYLALPSDVSKFEASYLGRLNRIGLIFFALHIPLMVLFAWANDTRPLLALAISGAVVAGPALAYFALSSPRAVSIVYGVAAMFMGGVLVHFGQGPMQIEMHFYFFALIAMLAVFGNPMVILAAAATVTLHHLALWFIVPKSVFNYDAPVWVVLVHAVFVVFDAAAAIFIARSFFDNVIGLERIVQRRTSELDERNRAMRLVLDNVSQGVTTINRRGVVSGERSAAFEQWLGAPASNETLFDLLRKQAPRFSEFSEAAWEQVTDGLMPLEVTLAQMPQRVTLGDAEYDFAYVPIGAGDAPDTFLLVVTDVTAQVRSELAARDRRECMAVFEHLLVDSRGVRGFFEEGDGFVRAIGAASADDMVTLNRALHTLKGNAAIFGLESIAAACHHLESVVAEENRLPSVAETEAISARWEAVKSDISRFWSGRSDVLEVSQAEHQDIERALMRREPAETVIRMVQALKYEPSSTRLEHFGEQARRIAERVGKQVDVKVEANGVRLEPSQWQKFWGTFIHLVRNAVDHGLEPAEDREANGKPSHGTLVLRTRRDEAGLVVEVTDDGRGIDWQRVAERARERGHAAQTPGQLRDALFCEGFSTKNHVTELSGRGVGMGAVREAALALDGAIEVDTAAGIGTTIRITFPHVKPVVSPCAA